MKTGKPILISLALALALAGCSTLMDAQGESRGDGSGDYPPLQVLDEVDTPPTVTYALQPEYPRLARAAAIEGTVWVRAVVDTLGRVQDAQVQTSSGTQSLDEAALAAVQKYRFKPAVKAGSSIPVTVSLPIVFELPK